MPIWGNINQKNAAKPRWCHYSGPFDFHVNYCLKITINSSFGRKRLFKMWQKSSVMVLRHIQMIKGMNMIALSKLVTFFPLTGDWLARLRVWPLFLCSKSPRFSYFEVSKTCTTYCWALERQFPGAAYVSEVTVSTHHSSAGMSCVPRSLVTWLSPRHLHPGTVLLQPHTNFCGATCCWQVWLAVPERCQGSVICKLRLNLQLSFLAF